MSKLPLPGLDSLPLDFTQLHVLITYQSCTASKQSPSPVYTHTNINKLIYTHTHIYIYSRAELSKHCLLDNNVDGAEGRIPLYIAQLPGF